MIYTDIETIFDHNVTREELYSLTGFNDTTRDEYLSIITNITQNKKEIQERAYVTLYYLYKQRGDIMKAITYAQKVPNSDWKLFTMLNQDH